MTPRRLGPDMDPQLDGEPLAPIPSHDASCWGCGAQGALRLRFVDDGRVTRARVPALGSAHAHASPAGDARDGSVLAVMEEAARHAAWARLKSADVETDGKTELYAKGVRADRPFVVEAWPGRRSGSGFFFYARVLQDGEERAHMETWLRGAP
jgi:hypothetical protein